MIIEECQEPLNIPFPLFPILIETADALIIGLEISLRALIVPELVAAMPMENISTFIPHRAF